MQDQKLIIISIQEKYLAIITKQMREILGDKKEILAVTVKDLSRDTVSKKDVVLISHYEIMGVVSQLVPEDCPIVVAKREINYTNTTPLTNLPPGQKILVVNDSKRNTVETVQSLREIVFEHEYIAYDPEQTPPNSYDYIVTPGERHLLPKELPNVIDIGWRLLDISTIEEIIRLLDLEYKQSKIVKRYWKACVSLGREQMQTSISRDVRNLAQYEFSDIITESDVMKHVIRQAKHLAKKEDVGYIHIQGETGTGKSMLAEAIHNYSEHANGPFLNINCAVKTFDVVIKELFGSEENGDVTLGLFEMARHGTVCIKEVNELPLRIQEKLYDVLKSRAFTRMGGSESIPLKVRVITTSSKNVEELMEQGYLLKELYELMEATILHLPPLVERKEDFDALLEDIKQRIGRTDIEFTKEALEYLKSYSWEGNVIELFNVITYVSLIEEPPIQISSLPFELRFKVDNEKHMETEQHQEMIDKIEQHGFLNESIAILKIFYNGKKEHTSYGRYALKKYLEEEGILLSEQQLRMRLNILRDLDLILVRKGRAGSTITRKGEAFLRYMLLKH